MLVDFTPQTPASPFRRRWIVRMGLGGSDGMDDRPSAWNSDTEPVRPDADPAAGPVFR
jgi:hypothetical protein